MDRRRRQASRTPSPSSSSDGEDGRSSPAYSSLLHAKLGRHSLFNGSVYYEYDGGRVPWFTDPEYDPDDADMVRRVTEANGDDSGSEAAVSELNRLVEELSVANVGLGRRRERMRAGAGQNTGEAGPAEDGGGGGGGRSPDGGRGRGGASRLGQVPRHPPGQQQQQNQGYLTSAQMPPVSSGQQLPGGGAHLGQVPEYMQSYPGGYYQQVPTGAPFPSSRLSGSGPSHPGMMAQPGQQMNYVSLGARPAGPPSAAAAGGAPAQFNVNMSMYAGPHGVPASLYGAPMAAAWGQQVRAGAPPPMGMAGVQRPGLVMAPGGYADYARVANPAFFGGAAAVGSRPPLPIHVPVPYNTLMSRGVFAQGPPAQGPGPRRDKRSSSQPANSATSSSTSLVRVGSGPPDRVRRGGDRRYGGNENNSHNNGGGGGNYQRSRRGTDGLGGGGGPGQGAVGPVYQHHGAYPPLTPHPLGKRPAALNMDEILGIGRGWPYVTARGTIALRLSGHVMVEMTCDQAIRVVNYQNNILLTVDSSGLCSALVHPNGRMHQHNARVEIVVYEENGNHKYAKMWYKGVSFTSERSSLVYLVDEGGTRTTADRFSPQLHAPAFATSSVFLNGSCHGCETAFTQCYAILQDTYDYYKTKSGTDVWMINNVRVSQTDDLVVTVSRDTREAGRLIKRKLKTSSTLGTAYLSTSMVHATASMGPNPHLFVRRGERRLHKDPGSLVVRNGGHSAGFDDKGRLKVF